MPATSQSEQLLSRISRETLKNKKDKLVDNIKKADTYIKQYGKIFRIIKSFDNVKWNKLFDGNQDSPLRAVLVKHRAGMLEMGRLLEKLMKERKVQQGTLGGSN